MTSVPTPAPVTLKPIVAAGGSQTYKPPSASKDINTIVFPKEMIAIVGESGQGKTFSFRNVDWETTAYIDTESKGFPFDHRKIKHYYPCDSHADVEKAVENIKAAPGKIKVIVIDSLYMYMEKLMRYCKMVHKGYEIYNAYNDTLGKFITTLQKSGLIVACVCMPELVTITDDQGKNTNARRIYTFGREHEGKLERYFLIVLYTSVKKGADGNVTYTFLTNNDGISSAKSPPALFGPDNRYVDNDMAAVFSKLIGTGTAA